MNHQSKKTIREYWSKSLLGYIHEKLGYKLTYLGLPAENAHDVLCWIDYIDSVVAFQCRQYPEPSSVAQPLDVINKLQDNLLELERQGKLSNFSLYDGYIEEVLIKGKDTVGQEYVQDDTVTVYNLDFCNGITTPIYYYDDDNKKRSAYKSQAIRKLLELQRDICSKGKDGKFVMFLTVNSDFFGTEESRFLKQDLGRDITKYLGKVTRSKTSDKQIRKLRAYIYHLIKTIFCSASFSPQFLPTIYYQGSSGFSLAHFTIVGVYNNNPSSIAPVFQKSNDILNEKFLQIARGNKFSSMTSQKIAESNVRSSSVQAFEGSEFFRKLWA